MRVGWEGSGEESQRDVRVDESEPLWPMDQSYPWFDSLDDSTILGKQSLLLETED